MALTGPASSARPLGISLIQHACRRKISFQVYQASALILTFIAYTLYHVSRKPSSIVKSTLISSSAGIRHSRSSPSRPVLAVSVLGFRFAGPVRGWAPFDGDSGAALMGEIDVAFLAVYAVGTFFAGHLGDRFCLRWILSVGMVCSGAFTCLFGLAYWWDVHWLPYFFIMQMATGLFQATGWPSVVSVVANWFGRKKRGLIMGLWNAHTSFGNICGSLIAASLLDEGWGWAFVVPGLAMMAGGVLMFLFLVVHPSIVGYSSNNTLAAAGESSALGEDEEAPKLHKAGQLSLHQESRLTAHEKESFFDDHPMSKPPLTKDGFYEGYLAAGGKLHAGASADQEVPLLVSYHEERSSTIPEELHAVGFLEALAIPGVVTFSLCLFFTKLVAYTFIYWLPFYISNTEIGGQNLSDEVAGNLSTLFDVGGVAGGVAAGHMFDKLNAKATTAAFFMWASIPAMAMYRAFGGFSLYVNVGLLLLSGLFVNGPYSLITTAVSADLGTHERIRGNARALATVTAIIDGTGSLGAALGPLLTGYICEDYGWNAVFVMLTISGFISGTLLMKQVSIELKTRSPMPMSS